MEISYRREAKRNYMVVGQTGGTAGYEARMLAGNEIRGLLRMHISYQDGQPLYCYDITSRQPLSRLLETRFITRDEICQLLIQIHAALTGMEEYLLSGGGLLLEPECIYVEPELFQTGLCLIPGVSGDFQDNLSRLLQYILKRVNHKDRESVVLAYGLYQESLKENCGMDDLLGLIAAERKKYIGTETREAQPGNSPNLAAVFRIEHKNGGLSDEDHEPEEKDDSSTDKGREQAQETDCLPEKKYVWLGQKAKQALVWLSVVILLPAALWMFKGKETVFGLRYILAAVDGALFLALAVFDIWKACKKNQAGNTAGENRYKEDGDPWRILYEDEEEDHKDTSQSQPDTGHERKEQETAGPEAYFQTTLLSDRSVQGEAVHRLTSLSGTEEDIIISYYPFVIGKHKDLADYVLPRDTVSRFHLRIDEDKGGYTITDLNSTNGTKVKGHLLEANETVDVEAGDQVYIADLGYIFS